MTMEENQAENTGTPSGATTNETASTGSTGSATTQSAQADMQAAANRAKAATAGFKFDNLFLGRIDNMNYLFAVVGSIVLGFILGMIPIIGLLVSLVFLVIGLGVSARRFHDIGITGWASLALMIPFLGLLGVIFLCWKHGDAGSNAYGAAPDPKRDLFKAILNT